MHYELCIMNYFHHSMTLQTKERSGSVPLHQRRCDYDGKDFPLPRGSSEQSPLCSVFLNEKHSPASLLLLFPPVPFRVKNLESILDFSGALF